MFDKPTASHTLGLDLDDFSLKGAVLTFSGGKVKVDELFDYYITVITREDEGNVKQFYIAEEKQHLTNLSNTHLIITAAAPKDVLVRPLEMRLIKNKDIDAALAFQVEPILPYPADQALVDKILLSKDKECSKLSVVILRKDHLKEHLDSWKSLDIDAEIVTGASQALAQFANLISSGAEAAYILHLGIENSFCILLDDHKLVAAQTVSSGIKDILNVYAQANGLDIRGAFQQLTQQNIDINSELLKEAIETLRLNITRTVYALAKNYKNKEISQLLVSGPGALLEGLERSLCASLNKTQRPPDKIADLGISLSDCLLYDLPIGEALSGLPNVVDQINFRQQEFAYPEPWKRLKYPILQYFGLCLGISIALTIFGSLYLHYREGETRRQYIELLDAMNKPYKEFEKDFYSKTSYKKRMDNDVIPLKDLTTKDIENRLTLLQKDLQATPQIFPLQPNVPMVSDVLAWISNHPIVNGGKKEEGVDQPGGLQIENFSYTMAKRPEPTKKQEKYQVKVELEFSSPTPKLAREFHDALIAPNDFVDPKGEIKWTSNKDRYRTSFYLKDKTQYPNL